MIFTILHVQSILDYNGDKRFINKHLKKKKNIIKIANLISTIWEQHFEWDIW